MDTDAVVYSSTLLFSIRGCTSIPVITRQLHATYQKKIFLLLRQNFKRATIIGNWQKGTKQVVREYRLVGSRLKIVLQGHTLNPDKQKMEGLF